MFCRGSGTNFLFPDDHYGSNGPARSIGHSAYCDWTRIDANSSDRNPTYESLGEPRTEYRTGRLCWRMGTRTTVVVLGGPDRRRHGRRNSVCCDLRVKNVNGRDPSSEEEYGSIVASVHTLHTWRRARFHSPLCQKGEKNSSHLVTSRITVALHANDTSVPASPCTDE
jgi:hypothetical protein